ncbi:peptidoglycan-recognition protein SC2-like isoform X2 [Paramacrobiotus metropolitanus]|uniref:peptidoglycan-recognition protein SC2-like isoform X2 n=1 Tax=Paramacrobiotus metropolitanus TaxID=2943436 RepID=UPI0024457CF2|nr:peptidoglycan-recognition protein SC2-like isoform X2 [Paramacrobiotus metropolitanus]
MKCTGINITARSAWGAPSMNVSIPYLIHPVRYIVYTHTYGEACNDFRMCRMVVSAIRDFHMDTSSWTAQTVANFVPEIFYNFLIGMDGSIFEGRGWDRRAQFHRDYDQNALVIAFIENISLYGEGYKKLTYAAALAANGLLNCAISSGYLDPANYNVIINMHQMTESYILNPQTMQRFSDGVVAGIVFGVVLIIMLFLVLLSLLWQYLQTERMKTLCDYEESRHRRKSKFSRVTLKMISLLSVVSRESVSG